MCQNMNVNKLYSSRERMWNTQVQSLGSSFCLFRLHPAFSSQSPAFLRQKKAYFTVIAALLQYFVCTQYHMNYSNLIAAQLGDIHRERRARRGFMIGPRLIGCIRLCSGWCHYAGSVGNIRIDYWTYINWLCPPVWWQSHVMFSGILLILYH